MTADPRRELFRCLSVGYMILAAGLSVPTALPQVREHLAMSDTVTSLHGSFFGWAMLALGLLAAGAVTRFGRIRAFGVGIVLLGIGSVLFGTARSVAQSLGGAALNGVGAACIVVAIPGVLTSAFGEERSAIFTKLNVMPVFGGLSVVAGLTLALHFGVSWRIPIIAIPVALATVGMTLLRPILRTHGGTNEEVPPRVRNVVSLLRIRAVRHRFIVQVAQITIEFAIGAWVIVFLREEGGFSKGLAPIGGLTWTLGMLVSRLLVPRMIGLLGRRLEATGLALTTISTLTLLAVHAAPIRLLAVAGTAFGMGPLYTLGVERMFLGAERAGRTDAGSVAGLAAMASGVGVILGPLIVGTLADAFTLTTGLLYAPVMAFICSTAALLRVGGEIGLAGQSTAAAESLSARLRHATIVDATDVL